MLPVVLAVSTQVTQCPALAWLPQLAASNALSSDPRMTRLVPKVPGGVGRGRCRQPLFSPNVGNQVCNAVMTTLSTCFTVGTCVTPADCSALASADAGSARAFLTGKRGRGLLCNSALGPVCALFVLMCP